MTTYYITVKTSADVGYWERVETRTFDEAKAIATRRYGRGLRGGVMLVAVGNDDDSPRQILATRPVNCASQWRRS